MAALSPRGLFALFRPRPSHFERIIMSQLSDLKDLVATLQAESQASSAKADVAFAKVDALITLTDNIKERLVQLGEDGQMPPGELSALTSAINASIESIHEIGTRADDESGKVDAATTRDADTTGDAGDGSGTGDAGDGTASGDTTGAGSGDAGSTPSGDTTVADDSGTPAANETP